jgi:hypothetical protein
MQEMDSLTDELIGMAKNLIDNEIYIRQLQKDRWNCTTFTLANGKVRLVVIDQEKLDINFAEELRVNENITKLQSLFSSLDIIFENLQLQLPNFVKPCISELKKFRMDLSNDRFLTDAKLRKDAAFLLDSARSKGRSIDEVLADPQFTDYKKGAEMRMKRIDEQIKICDDTISQIHEIITR